jgi:hypothetical protein
MAPRARNRLRAVRLRLGAGALAAALLGGAGAASETERLSYRGLEVDGQSAATTYSEMAALRYELDVGTLVAGLGSARIDMVLVDASPAARRQALAHALDCWWAAAAGGVVCTRSPTLPAGRLLVSSCTSTLVNLPAYEDLVRRLLQPWLGRDAGLSLLPDIGLWSATLDADGQARLNEIIGVLEQGRAQCASTIPDPDQPDLERRLSRDVHAGSWPALVEALSAAASCSVSLDHATARGPFPGGGVAFGPCRVGEVPSALQAAGISARFLHGVLCLARSGAGGPLERQHPGQRRLIALLPIAHLAPTRLDGELIATSLKRHSGSRDGWWAQPGADLVYLPPLRALLVAADAATQQEVLAGLHRIDRLGLAEGLRALAAASQGAEPAR